MYGSIPENEQIKSIRINLYIPQYLNDTDVTIKDGESVYWCIYGINSVSFNTVKVEMKDSYGTNWGANSTEGLLVSSENCYGQDGWNFKDYTPTVSDTKGYYGGLYLRGPVSYSNVVSDRVATMVFSNKEVITSYKIVGAFLDLDSYATTQVKLYGAKTANAAEGDWTELTFNYNKTSYSKDGVRTHILM